MMRSNQVFNKRYGKKMVFFLAAWLYTLGSAAQTAADSLFRNYLYDTRCLYFRQLPVRKGAFVFFGDSITHWGDWSEFTGDARALNRGIAGDNTYGLLNRVDEVTRHLPEKVFILIGTNDINIHIASEASLKNYEGIIRAIRRQSPHTAIYVQSILPINNQLINRAYYTGTNEAIQRMNHSLDSLAGVQQVTYVDLYAHFLDHSGQMDAAYTSDGLHLTGIGYLHWIGILKSNKYL